MISVEENFCNFLIFHDAYDRYCNNLRNQNNRSFQASVALAIEGDWVPKILDRNLSWAQTPEGREYWSNLNRLWETAYANKKEFRAGFKSIW